MKNFLHDAYDWLLAFLLALVPGALGSVVSLIYEEGMTWGRRITAMMVGITVSYFARNAAHSLTGWDDYVLQAVGFVVGMTAYKATPRVITGLVDRAALLPALLDPFLKKKDR